MHKQHYLQHQTQRRTLLAQRFRLFFGVEEPPDAKDDPLGQPKLPKFVNTVRPR